MAEPTHVYSRTGDKKGELTGASHMCTLEGCRGQRLAVRWPKRKSDKRARITYPCTKGMDIRPDGQWQIM